MQLPLFCVLAATVLVCKMSSVAANLYASDSEVVELTDDNYNRTVLQTDDVWLVKFYAPWCKYSRMLTTEYTKVAKTMKGFVKVGALDVDKHRNITDYYRIRGFPTIVIFINKTDPVPFNSDGGSQAIDIANKVIETIQVKVNTELQSIPQESSTLSQDGETSTFNESSTLSQNRETSTSKESSTLSQETTTSKESSTLRQEPSWPQETSTLPQESSSM